MNSAGTSSRTTGPLQISDVGPRFGSTKLAAGAPHIRAFCECVGVCAIRAALILAVLSALLLIAARPAQAQSGPYGVVSPTTMNFRGAVGQTSPSQLVSLKNTGDSELTVSNISISGDFAISKNQCANGVKPGTHCNVYVTFTPPGPGTETGTLTFVDNASNSPQFVSLTGTIGEIVLHNFTGGSDGADPWSNLTFDAVGNLYGTTAGGGAFGAGTVFELSPNGVGGWNNTVLYGFTGGVDGGNPLYDSDVIFDRAGNLYGITYSGGATGNGVVYELSPVGASWTESVLYSFCSQPDCADGGGPVNSLIMDSAGNLYGTTCYGANGGIVFKLSPSGGGWTEQVIYSVGYPAGYAGLTMDAAGNIFGASWFEVYELSPNGSGSWTSAVIHGFAGGPKDGTSALGTPVLDKAGNLYGTTQYGGTNNAGTVYKLRPITKGKKKGEWIESVLHSFESNGKDGNGPWGGVVFDAAGNIYGTTPGGGQYGDGTVYELAAKVGKGYEEQILWSFNSADGLNPFGTLILDSAGNLYGTATFGGAHFYDWYGVVFEVTP